MEYEIKENEVFVFGSNLAGVHGAGAAKTAYEKYGATYRQGVGLQGRSYAIPTKDYNIQTLPLAIIQPFVLDFLAFAAKNKHLTFKVTRIGCGLAGYTDSQIGPMFKGAPDNCILPEGWGK